jgi:murein L,D-transpeptidase YcbB/YkuD
VLDEAMDSLLQKDSTVINASDSAFAETEIRLTQKFVEYAASHPEHITREHMYYMVPAKKQDAMTLADSLLNKTDSLQYAGNSMYRELRSQLERYYQAARKGGMDSLVNIKAVKKGNSSPAIAAIKKKLQLTGDYAGTDTSQVYNDSLSVAIKNYQLRHGLKPTGNIDDSLVAALNVPLEKRIRQILVNMNRAMWMPVQNDSARVVVNIPAQTLYVYSDSGRVMEMPVIVGKEGDGTIMFSSSIDRIVFNPYWNIPESIVREEIMPEMKADATYLRKNNMEVVNENDSIPVVRQLPGKNNPLGEVKFLFPNVHHIYLHDTPDKNLFAKNDRTLSHGCIRVADANQLAAWLLNGENGWDQQKIRSAMNGDKEQIVELKNPKPVSIVYLTAWVDENGMQFRNDVYGHDEEAMERMFI